MQANPLALYGLFLLFLINPFKTCYYKSRFWLLKLLVTSPTLLPLDVSFTGFAKTIMNFLRNLCFCMFVKTQAVVSLFVPSLLVSGGDCSLSSRWLCRLLAGRPAELIGGCSHGPGIYDMFLQL